MIDFKAGIRRFGFLDVITEENVDYTILKQIMDNYQIKLMKNGQNKTNTLFLIYYAAY